MNSKAHSYIIKHAILILEHDGQGNFAGIARQFFNQLEEGTWAADQVGEMLRIVVSVDTFFILPGVLEITLYEKNICHMGSLEHYYNPQTRHGLDLSYFLGGYADFVATFLQYGIRPVSIEVIPCPNFSVPYPSAADHCQQEYDLAVKIWQDGVSKEEGLTAWESAFYHLGWACHFLADCAVSPHTVDDRWKDHDDYENLAEGIGWDNSYHAQSISDNPADYRVTDSPRKMVHDEAAETNPELYLYDAGLSDGGLYNWSTGLLHAIPRAEKYTARLLSKFFTEVGISREPPPITVKLIEDKGPEETGIKDACLYYRERGDQFWKLVITDSQGACQLFLTLDGIYEFRPAMPGYVFEGNYYGNAPSISEFHEPCSPVPYTHVAYIGSRSLKLRLRKIAEPPMPVVARESTSRIQGRPLGLGQRAPVNLEVLVSHELEHYASDVIAEQIEIATMGTGWASPYTMYMSTDADYSVAYVRVQLCCIASVKNGDIILSKQALEQIIQESGFGPDSRMQQSVQRESTPATASLAVVKALKRLPVQTITKQNGEESKVYRSPKVGKPNPLLNAAKLLLLPAPAGCRVRVEVVSDEYGYIGLGTATSPNSLDVKTDENGVAWVRVKPGNQAGKLKLRLRVMDIPEVEPDMLPTALTELLVMPDDNKDSTPFYPPRLEVCPDHGEGGWPGADRIDNPKNLDALLKPRPGPRLHPFGVRIDRGFIGR